MQYTTLTYLVPGVPACTPQTIQISHVGLSDHLRMRTKFMEPFNRNYSCLWLENFACKLVDHSSRPQASECKYVCPYIRRVAQEQLISSADDYNFQEKPTLMQDYQKKYVNWKQQ